MVDGYLLWFFVCFGNRYEAPFLFETDTRMYYSSVQLPLLVPDVCNVTGNGEGRDLLQVEP